jgi:hypothetical protein
VLCHAALGLLQVRDILIAVDGVPIANDGTIQLPDTQAPAISGV